MLTIKRAITRAVFLVLVAGLAAAADDAADAARLIEVLGIHAGASVADIGAGDGVLTIPIAHTVGPAGRVYATELGGSPLEQLRKALTRTDVTNIEIVEGHALRTNLPVECCDSIFIRNVYHHFADPPAMNASLRQSLKPGGKLAILDFAPNGSEATSPADRAGSKTHGVTAETVGRELQQAGLEPVMTEQRDKRTFLVVVQRPGP
jgi:ubiquinone/menaquinone biosynthesis C-methylase UbiE